MTGENSSDGDNAYGICAAAQDTDELAVGFVATQDDLRVLVKDAFSEMFVQEWTFFLYGSIDMYLGAEMRLNRLWAYLGEETFCDLTKDLRRHRKGLRPGFVESLHFEGQVHLDGGTGNYASDNRKRFEVSRN